MADAIIIGGGIIGLSAAYYLSKAGRSVTIIDKGDLYDNCSYGNAGMIVPSHFVPLAAPGMIRQGIRWMFSSKSPFYVKPGLNRQLLGWGMQFIKHATDRHVEASAAPLRDLSLLSKKLYQDLAAEPGFDFELKNNGILAFYKTEKAAEEEYALVEKGRQLGLEMEILNAGECRALQPQLELDVLGAAYYRCDSHLYPTRLIHCLLSWLERNGVAIIRNTAIDRAELQGGKIARVFSGKKPFTADQYVLAAGSWSPQLARLMNIRLSLMPGKGYSLMEDEPLNRMSIPALLCEARVAITPMNGQIRYGGTMELARLNRHVNLNRVQGIIEAVPRYFPDLKPRLPGLRNIWYGFRPSSPDGLPYIGRPTRLDNLVIATGHGMMGLSLGPATGLLVSQLLGGTPTEINTEAFSPSRG